MAEIVIKKCVLEVDFQNNFIIDTSTLKVYSDGAKSVMQYRIDPNLKDKFLSEVAGDFWHTEEDKLQAFIYYDDGSSFVQRRKAKYSFAENAKVWTDYTFVGYTKEQAEELKNKIVIAIQVQNITKDLKVEKKLQKVDEEYLFFDAVYAKRMRERNAMLASTDWRVLDDVVDTYPGEKDMWKLWRQKVRETLIKDPTEFPTPLDFFRYIKTLKWPIDPKNYKIRYPERDVEYLSTDDQWVKRDTDASTDFVESRLENILELRQKYVESRIRVKKEVKDMMKLLRIEEELEEDLDYDRFVIDEEMNDLAN